MSQVEQSILLQIQDIAAVKQAFTDSLSPRQPATLWWLVDHSEDIAYENRVKGSSILAVDQNVDNVNIPNVWSDWFNLHNSYFSQDQPITTPSGVTNLKTAIELYYRWRVPQYFNDIMAGSSGQGISPQYVFPYSDFNLGTWSSGAFQKGNGPVDPTKTGPGILSVTPVTTPGSTVTLTLTAVYPTLPPVSPPAPPPPAAPPPVALSVPVSSTNPAGVSIEVGGQAVTNVATGGLITVAATTGFAVGYPVVIAENTIPMTPDTALPVWKTEVAVVINIAGLVLTLGQQVPSGSTTAPTPGLRNTFTTAAKVYPLFVDVTVSGGGGNDLQFGFFPEWGGGFVDVKSIVIPQVAGVSRATMAEASSVTDEYTDADEVEDEDEDEK